MFVLRVCLGLLHDVADDLLDIKRAQNSRLGRTVNRAERTFHALRGQAKFFQLAGVHLGFKCLSKNSTTCRDRSGLSMPGPWPALR